MGRMARRRRTDTIILGGLLMLDGLLQNPESITFPVLFVGLLVYVMKTNNDREHQYRETIDKLTEHFEVVKDIDGKVENVTKFIYKREREV